MGTSSTGDKHSGHLHEADTATTEDARSGTDLVDRIRAGDKQAEGELFNRYRRGISFILRKQGASPDVAEDLFQETVTTVIDKIKNEELREADRLSAFICSVAKNLTIVHFRKSSRMLPVAAIAMDIPSPLDQHEQLLRKEEAQIVRRIIGELKMDRDRQILIRYYLGEEDRANICKDLGLSSEQFSRVLHRALQRFKEALEIHGENRESGSGMHKPESKQKVL